MALTPPLLGVGARERGTPEAGAPERRSLGAATPVDLAVVIVSYQCRDLVVACVERLASIGADCRVEVVVVDNGSTDGTAAALEGRCRVIPLGYNSGFSTANNVGFAATDSRHVLVLNPDTLVDRGALDALVAFLDSHPNAGVVAPDLVNPDGSDQYFIKIISEKL